MLRLTGTNKHRSSDKRRRHSFSQGPPPPRTKRETFQRHHQPVSAGGQLACFGHQAPAPCSLQLQGPEAPISRLRPLTTHDRAAKIGPLQWPRQWCGCRNAVCGRPGAVYSSVLCHPLRCAAHLQLCGSGLEKQGPYAGNSFLISCPLRLVFEIFSFRFFPLPFSLLPSLSLLFAPDIYPLVPPWAVGSASQANQVAFFSVSLLAARLAVGPSHSGVSYGQNRRPSAPPLVRDSLSHSPSSTAPARLSIEFDDAPAAQLCSALPARLFNSSATLAVVALPPVTMQTVPSVSLLTFSDGTRHT